MGNTTSCSCESDPAPTNGYINSTFAREETSNPLRWELAALSNKDLRARARATGATPEQLAAAADSNDPKAALVALVGEVAKAAASAQGPPPPLVEDRGAGAEVAPRPPLQRSLSIGLGNGLPVGAENLAPALEAALDNGLGALDAAVAVAPRRGGLRVELQALAARAEATLEDYATEDWCAGLDGCGGHELGELCGLLTAVRRDAP